jgi:hypothetical protein
LAKAGANLFELCGFEQIRNGIRHDHVEWQFGRYVEDVHCFECDPSELRIIAAFLYDRRHQVATDERGMGHEPSQMAREIAG